MSRHLFQRSLNLLLVGLLLFTFFIECGAEQPCSSQFPTRIVLNITAAPSHAVAVNWRTALLTENPRVQVANASDAPDFHNDAREIKAKITEITPIKDNVRYQYDAIIDGLQPQTLYAYRVGSDKNWSEWSQFKTAAASAEPFKFLYLGDPQNDIIAYVSRIFRSAYSKAPDAAFMLICGDLVADGSDDNLWAEWFYAAGWIPRLMPFVLTAGNHEYESVPRRLSPLYRPQFNLPLNGPKGVEETAYFFDYQGARLVLLNSMEKIDEQARWLDSLLTVQPQHWTILAMHFPLYPIASNRDYPDIRQKLLPIIDRNKVDLVLAGHDHAYARSYKLKNGQRVADSQSGTVYMVSVSGPKQYNLASKYFDLYAKMADHKQLFQIVNVSRNRLQVQTFTVTGQLLDEFELKK